MNLKSLMTTLFLGGVILILSGCGKEPITEEIVKQPYYLTVQAFTKSDQAGTITKNAKVIGTSEIVVTSQVAGRVNAINVDLGSNVGNGQNVVQLTDTAGSIRFGLEKGKLAVDSAQDSFAVQKANLEKQIADANIALDKAQLNLATTANDNVKQRERLQFDLNNANTDLEGSATQLQIQKLQKDLAKAQFDYQTKLDADDQTIANFVATAQNINTDINNLMSDVLTESDKILGVSNEFKNFNDDYEVYLGAKDINTKFKAKDTLLQLQGLQDELDALSETQISQDNLVVYLQSYRDILSSINTLITSIKDLLIATVPSVQLPQSGIDGLNAQFNGLASRSSGITSSITAQVNSINGFLSTYIQSQQSLGKQIDILQDQIEITEKGLNDAQTTTQLGVDRTLSALDSNLQNAQLTLDSTKLSTQFVQNTKDLNLTSIQNQLKSAQVALQELEFNAAKYTIRSPIRGVVSDVLVDVGQEVSPGTALARVVSNTQQLEINMNESELQYLTLGQQVLVSNEYQTGNATIDTIARVADKDGTFKVIIILKDDEFNVGSFVDVEIPLYDGDVMIPVNAVTIVDTNRGQINLRDGNTIINQTVTLGNIFGSNITIKDQIPMGMMLITSPIDNYDESKYILQVKPQE